MLDYTIITKLQVFAEDRDPEDESYAERLTTEQNEKLSILGFKDGEYLLHFFGSPWANDENRVTTIDDGIQMLAIKDGVDLVQYSNGNYGFVSYYNGEKDGFEIIG